MDTEFRWEGDVDGQIMAYPLSLQGEPDREYLFYIEAAFYENQTFGLLIPADALDKGMDLHPVEIDDGIPVWNEFDWEWIYLMERAEVANDLSAESDLLGVELEHQQDRPTESRFQVVGASWPSGRLHLPAGDYWLVIGSTTLASFRFSLEGATLNGSPIALEERQRSYALSANEFKTTGRFGASPTFFAAGAGIGSRLDFAVDQPSVVFVRLAQDGVVEASLTDADGERVELLPKYRYTSSVAGAGKRGYPVVQADLLTTSGNTWTFDIKYAAGSDIMAYVYTADLSPLLGEPEAAGYPGLEQVNPRSPDPPAVAPAGSVPQSHRLASDLL